MKVDGPQSVKWHENEPTSAKMVARSYQIRRSGMKKDDILSKSAVYFLSRPLYIITLAHAGPLWTSTYSDAEKFEKRPEQQTLLDDISQLSSKYLFEDLPCYHGQLSDRCG